MVQDATRWSRVDWSSVAADLAVHREAYRHAEPWPHLVLEKVFPEDLLDEVVREVQVLDRTAMASAATRTMRKRETAEERLLGPATLHALREFQTPEFLDFLGQLTGIDELTGDDERFWAGVHETPPGGFTMVHTDFQVHPTTKLFHRTNALLYLNREWEPGWGGQLELWPPDMKAIGRRIEPSFNSLVLFETTERTFHGLPERVACPEGTSRISLAAYQYSQGPPRETGSHRLSKYAARPGDDWRVGLPSWWDAKSLVPSPLRTAGAQLRRRFRNPRT